MKSKESVSVELSLTRLQLEFTTPDGEGTLGCDLPGTLTWTMTLPDARPEPPDPPDPDEEWFEITPSDNWQEKINEAGEGAHVRFTEGTYPRASIIPKTGQVIEGYGAVFDGEGEASYAFDKGPKPYPASVTWRGFKVTGYKPADYQLAAVLAGGHSPEESTEGWIVEECEICYNLESGARVGNHSIFRNNNIHHNHRLNIGGVGHGALVENCEIAYGNWEGRNDPGFEAGGTKFCQCDGLVLRGNDVHHNNGPALWFDENATRMVVEDNNVHDNNTEGIVIEICYNATIRNNTITDNGWNDPHNRYSWLWNSAIGVHSSPDCEVYGNTLSGNYNGITALQQDRSTYDNPAEFGAHEVRNLYVHDNHVSHPTVPATNNYAAASGLAKDWGPDEIFSSWGNRFEGNTYEYSEATQQHAWQNAYRTPEEWEAYGLS